MPVIRVAASQYTVGRDVDAGLEKLLSIIDQAADGGAQLVVSPEFSNHASLWSDQEYCWSVSVAIDGEFVNAVRERAQKRGIYVVFNVTLRREYPTVTDTNIFVGPDGEILGTTSKQVLISHENVFCTPGSEESNVFDTPLGRIGMYSCMDGVIPETTRVLAVKGAQVLVNTLNSMALDEASLHIPVRAAENGVWVVASNKSGPIVPVDMFEEITSRTGMAPHVLYAPGEAQVIAPSGEVIKVGGFQTDELVFAEIRTEDADDKSWADGDLMHDRRPDTYGAVASNTDERNTPPETGPVTVAPIQLRSDRPTTEVVTRAIDMAEVTVRQGARLIVLPELFPFKLDDLPSRLDESLAASTAALERLRAFCADQHAFLACSLISRDGAGYHHTGYLIDHDGEIAGEYHQVHLTDSMKKWAVAGNELKFWDTAIGRIGMLLGYDSVFPESTIVLTRLGVEIIVHPTSWRLGWEVDLGILERAAENHINIVSANRMDSPVRRGSLVIPAPPLPRIFDGELNPVRPIELPPGRETFQTVVLSPSKSREKTVSRMTDLIGGRKPALYGALVR